MRCLCCGKKLNIQTKDNWHSSCIKKFFGTKTIPEIDISEKTINNIAINNSTNGIAVTGVQKKLSLQLSKENTFRLTIINQPSGYILKPQTKEYECLPESEFLIMQMAKESKIDTVPFALIKSKTGEYLYITKRIDRIIKNNKLYPLGMEDFCQLDNRLTIDKYKGSYERCAKIIEKYSENKGLDIANLFIRIVFSYAIGNSDMHLKNFSFIENDLTGKYNLSPTYDMLPTNIIIKEDQEELALSLNGKKKNLRRNDFLSFANTIGLNALAAEKMIDKIILLENHYINLCKESYLSEIMKKDLEKLIINRIKKLKKQI